MQMNIFTFEALRFNVSKARAELYSAKENAMAAIVMFVLSSVHLVLCKVAFVEGASLTTNTNIFAIGTSVVGFVMLIFGAIVAVNAVIEFNSAYRRLKMVMSDLYRSEIMARKAS